MPAAPTPSNETERLQSLRALRILDTPPEERFDRITRLASRVIGTPIALISLVDEARQWFKSSVGLDASETPRDVAFCGHAILDSGVFVVPDAQADPRFSDNPLVTGAPHVRFYAGAPLHLDDGVRIGTLCAIDHKARTLTDDDLRTLAELAAMVVDEIDLRQHITELNAAEAELRRANESLEQFAHLASHDLRAPLKTIINLADMTMMDDPEHCPPRVRMIRDAAGELEAVVAGYRRLSKLRLGDREGVRVTTLVEAAKAQACAGGDVELEGDAVLSCDPQLLQSVFVNLIANANNHGAGGIRIHSEERDTAVVIRASNPISEPLEVDATVFAPFRRLSSEGDGTGLGLAIVDRVTQLHGGSAAASADSSSFAIELTFPILEQAS